MAPKGEILVSSGTYSRKDFCKPPRFSMEGLERAVSDLSFQMSKEAVDATLEDAKCECCGMCEECTPEYVRGVREKFSGKWICGLCSEAVKEEVEKKGGGEEEGLSAHMSACVRFNRIGRVYPALYQAEAMREILKKTTSMIEGRGLRQKSSKGSLKNGGIMRSSSCIPAITRDMNQGTMLG